MVDLAAMVLLLCHGPKDQQLNQSNICKRFSGMLDVNLRPIYLRELDGKDTSIERAQKIEAIERRVSEVLKEIARWEAAGE